MYEVMWYDWVICSVYFLVFKKCDRLLWVYSMLWIVLFINCVNEWIICVLEYVEICVLYKNYMCVIVYSVYINECIEVSCRYFCVFFFM